MLNVESGLSCGRIADEGPSRRGLRTHQQVEGGEVRDHQYGHVDDRDRVGGAQLPGQRRKADLVAMIVVDNDVDRPHRLKATTNSQNTAPTH